MTAIFTHELRSYFHTLTAWLFAAFLLCFVGIGAMMYNIQAAVSNFEYVLSFGCLVFVVIVPILTMRVLAEERRQKTDQLLYSLPVSTVEVVLGKYAALIVPLPGAAGHHLRLPAHFRAASARCTCPPATAASSPSSCWARRCSPWGCSSPR